jgi:hypothetical protein
MRCPCLIVHGSHDALGVQRATRVRATTRGPQRRRELKLLDAEETGAEHCQHDNPSIAMEDMGEWLADVVGIDQRR